ncbi:PadR family transcriptional regulator [Microcystis aeruginosa]|uniref:PadR family transcriptional regulator n=1 Tax=Microcystis aeruginosa TaxID=1126 RepID=UPI002930E458|nr:PadR family transcriptional regulator [Microcystis aeruginosa]WOB66901.1 PadR family transcriptional regulator [Microcystis aeruginosa LE3]
MKCTLNQLGKVIIPPYCPDSGGDQNPNNGGNPHVINSAEPVSRAVPKPVSVTPNEELVLLSLQNKELYGLQIIESIADASGGHRKLRIGSLYPTLHSLEEKGLIKSRWGDERPDDRGGARRRYYHLTQLGERTMSGIQEFRHNLLHWKPV